MKVCPRCKGLFEPDSFVGYCRPCKTDYMRVYERKRRAELKAKRVKPTKKTCTRCCREYPRTRRYFGSEGHRLRSWCKRCCRAYEAQRYQRRKDIIKRQGLERVLRKVAA